MHLQCVPAPCLDPLKELMLPIDANARDSTATASKWANAVAGVSRALCEVEESCFPYLQELHQKKASEYRQSHGRSLFSWYWVTDALTMVDAVSTLIHDLIWPDCITIYRGYMVRQWPLAVDSTCCPAGSGGVVYVWGRDVMLISIL